MKKKVIVTVLACIMVMAALGIGNAAPDITPVRSIELVPQLMGIGLR